MSRWPRRWAAQAIAAYQNLVSPGLGANCRYRPTCSSYAREAIERFGVLRGGWLALRRLGRCHPLRPGGYDPVPEDEPMRKGRVARSGRSTAVAGNLGGGER